MGSISVIHWFVVGLMGLPTFLAAISTLGPFHGPAIFFALTMPPLFH